MRFPIIAAVVLVTSTATADMQTDTLRGLRGAGITAGVQGAEVKGITPDAIRIQIMAALIAADIAVLSPQEQNQNQALVGVSVLLKRERGAIIYHCRAMVVQGVYLARNQDLRSVVPTWEMSVLGTADDGKKIESVVGELLTALTAAWRGANPAR